LNRWFTLSPVDALINLVAGCCLRHQTPVWLDWRPVGHRPSAYYSRPAAVVRVAGQSIANGRFGKGSSEISRAAMCLFPKFGQCAAKVWVCPKRTGVFDFMARGQWIDTQLAEALKRMVALRNIAVHDDQSLMLPILANVIPRHLDEFLAFTRIVLQRG
jgi:hypothetical protein